MIYFLQPLEGGPVKIGTTEDFDTRRKALEAHYGRPLALLATMDGGRETEAEIHARFAHLRFGRTEQFQPAPDLMAFIGRPLLVDSNPDAVEAMDTPGKTKGTLIRVKVELAEAIRRAAAQEDITMVAFADRYLLPVAEKRYRDNILREAKRLEGEK